MRLSILSLALTAVYESGFSWRSLFADGTPGFRINVEEAIRLNKAAIGSKTSGFTPEELAACVAFQDSAGTLPVTAMEQPLGLILDTKLGVPVRGPELVTNGDFSNGLTGWSASAPATISLASGAAVVTRATTANYPSINQTLNGLVIGRWYEVTANLTNPNGLDVYLGFAGFTEVARSTATTAQMHCYLQATATSHRIDAGMWRSAGAVGQSVMFDNISVREIPGNHFVQPSNTPSRPIVSRRVNLLTATDTLATQSVTTLAASYVLTFGGTGSVTLSGTATGTYSAGTHMITTTAGTLTVTVSGSVTNADLRLFIDADLLPYQRVISPTDYDEVGFPAYARFDGLDDWLESGGTVDMTSTDEVTVIAGVTKLVDGSYLMVLEASPLWTGSDGTITLSTASSSGYALGLRGTLPVVVNLGTPAAPAKSLLTGIGGISAHTAILRVNGAQVASSVANQGTGNYGNHKFYMGRRAGTSSAFNGRIYGLTVVGKLLTGSQLTAAEQAERKLGRLY